MHTTKIFAFLLLVLAACQPNTSTQTEYPNLLLILVDDMGYGDLSSAGNPLLKTPNLDELRSKSVSFDHFYVSPVCAPTRASLLTGLYHQRTSVQSVTNGYESMRPDAVTLAELLQPLGYRTGLFGKWHLGEYYPMVPQAQGFDEFLGFRTGHTANYYDPVLEHNGKAKPCEGYITDVLTKKALAFINQRATPFFCFLSLNAPHTPLQVDSSYFLPYLAQGLNERTARVYGMMENIDDNIGHIFEQLDATDNLKNTVVVFMSDNGPISGWKVPQEAMRYNAGLRDQKFTTYEGGIRTQSFWYRQGYWSAKSVKKLFAAHIDLVPTILDLLPVKPAYFPDSGLDGLSLVPILEGKATPAAFNKRILFQHFDLSSLKKPAPYPGGIALQWPWKMVNDTALYQLEQDPGESINVAEGQPEVLTQLSTAYETWWKGLELSPSTYGMSVPAGYDQENPVLLRPHHGLATGKVKFTGQRGLLGERIGSHPSGVDGDWLANWQEAGDGIHWLIEIVEAGRYEIAAQLRGVSEKETVSFQLEINGKSYQTSHYLPRRSSNWQTETLQELDLQAGIDTLRFTLRTALPSTNSLEISGISLKKLD